MQKKKTIAICLIAIAILVISITTAYAGPMDTGSGKNKEKIVTVIRVTEGDTLWELAKPYYAAESGTYREFIREIEETNGIADGNIKIGQNLYIPHWVEEGDYFEK